MLPPDVLDLHGAAGELGVTYGWLQTHWRETPGFPPPYFGAGKGQRPRWWRNAILDFKAGRRWAAGEAAPIASSAARPVANDLVRHRPDADEAALIAAAGG